MLYQIYEGNMSSVGGNFWESMYLCGIAAASVTQSKKLGFVAPYAIPMVIAAVNAFELGAQSVDPDITTNVVFIGSWSDAGLQTLALYCSSDGAHAATPETLRDELAGLGWSSAVMLDGGGSSQCDFGGERITASRKVHNWICVYLKQAEQTPPEEEDKPMSKHTVCLDPGHGPGNVNGSPDGTYKEWEFTWDMAQRVKPLLEAQGVGVVLTKTTDNYPSLTERANISNKAKPDCFVSIHTNAGQGKGWSSGSGLEIYTSAGPMTAQRNVLASKLVNAFHAAGVALRSEPIKHNIELTVLAKTDAPACLIEYGFHTNKTDVEYLKDTKYRDKLAEATAKGICDWLGVAWQGETGADNAEDTPDVWAAEAWQKAKDKGVLDGTRPRDNMTRQELAVVLDRLNLI